MTTTTDAADNPAVAARARLARGYVRSYEPQRTCAHDGCETTVSRYNANDTCWRHTAAAGGA